MKLKNGQIIGITGAVCLTALAVAGEPGAATTLFWWLIIWVFTA